MNKIEELIKKLKEEVEENDNEVVHSLYDDIMVTRLAELDPKLLKRIDRIVKGVNFWYA